MTQDIELHSISRFRGELMGIAMLVIILFHVGLPRESAFFGLCRMGNIGVDMFLFLSGVGLWFSWTKSQDLRRFYWHRLVRIYPAWLTIACLYFIPHFKGGSLWAWIDLLGEIGFNWEFWIRDELTFWYIPATMMLYLFAPLYMELIRRHPIYRWLPVMMIMWCFAVEWVLPIHNAVGHIEIFWSRVPIFFLGINCSEAVRQKRTLDGSSIWLIALMFVVSLSACLYLEQVRHGRFPLFAERMIYIPLTISGILLLCQALDHAPSWTGRCLKFVGAISLECYLIHIEFVLRPIRSLALDYWPTSLLTIAITLPLAWLLHKLCEKIQNKLLAK